MKKTLLQILALFLILCALLPLAACGGGGETSESRSESRSESTSDSASESSGVDWSNVYFDGEDLIVNVNVYQNIEQTFGAADVYSRGPDSLVGADEVGKLIYDRNLKLESELGVYVTWEETNEEVGKNKEIIETFVKTSVDNTPDIFITDVFDIVNAMVAGCLWNVNDLSDGRGGTVESYFDFSHPSWLEDYMMGTSFSAEKRYVLASDYFVDVIRFAYVLFVNRDMFDEVMQGQYITVHDLYEYVKDGYWDYDLLIQYIEITHKDTVNLGTTDKEDERKGMVASPLMKQAFTYSNGLSVLGWEGKANDSTPYVIENHPDYFTFVERFSELFNTQGLYYTGATSADAQAANILFLDGSYLFAVSKLGEMESVQFRDSQVNKGILPIPKFDQTLQPEYHTVVHDQADVACILNNVRHFTAASAYLQMASEESVDIMKEYYDKSLKLKYNEDKDTQAVLDLVHDSITTPFEIVVARMIVAGSGLPSAPYSGTLMHHMVFADAEEQKNSFASSWAAAYDGWCKNLDRLVEIFEELD